MYVYKTSFKNILKNSCYAVNRKTKHVCPTVTLPLVVFFGNFQISLGSVARLRKITFFCSHSSTRFKKIEVMQPRGAPASRLNSSIEGLGQSPFCTSEFT